MTKSLRLPVLLRAWLALTLLALALWGPRVAAQDTTSSAPTSERPLIFIRSSRVEPDVVAPGTLCRLYIELHNVGEASAKNIIISIAGANFVPELSSSTKTVSGLQPNEHGMVWQELRAAPDIATGTYPITVQLSYQDDSGNLYTGTEVVGIKAQAAPPTARPRATRPQLVIDSVVTEPPQLIPGGQFTLTLTLHNTGTGEARNLLLTHGGPSSFAPMGTGNVTAFGNIGWQQTVAVVMPMVADQAAKVGANLHPITLDYDSVGGEHTQSAQNVTLQVGPGGTPTAAPEPLVVIASYRVAPETLVPGQPFTLTLVAANVSTSDARRLTLTLGGQNLDASKSAPIAPLGAGNVRYLPELKAGASAELPSRFIVDGLANAGVYILAVGLNFFGAGEKMISREEQISLVVKVKPQLLLNFYRPLAPAMVGQPIDLPLEILNVGRARVNSNEAEIVSTALQVTTPRTYVGALEAGASVTLDGQAIAETPGEQPFTVQVHYIDDFNEPQVFEIARTIQVEAAPESESSGDIRGPDGQIVPVGPGGKPMLVAPQRPWLLRLLRGLLGLGSS